MYQARTMPMMFMMPNITLTHRMLRLASLISTRYEPSTELIKKNT